MKDDTIQLQYEMYVIHALGKLPQGATNMELAEMLGWPYHRVQRTTRALAREGLIRGRLNQWGIRSNVTWRAL